MLPLNDTDFWWLRYVLGVMLPICFAVWGIYSIVTLHSYTVWSTRSSLSFVPVEGKQAIIMGVAYLGMALVLFANCYAQYHEKMAYYYQWILVPGVLMAGGGFFWCSLSLLHF